MKKQNSAHQRKSREVTPPAAAPLQLVPPLSPSEATGPVKVEPARTGRGWVWMGSVALFIGTSLGGCAHLSRNSVGSRQTGLASWYGSRFQGRKTANGERFDMHALTAAHRTLPLGTRVRVRSLTTGKSVVVRINDRGPQDASRVLDLSYAAADAIGIVKLGTDKIELEVE